MAGEEVNLEFVDDCIDRHEPVVRVLRLLCLYSLTNNGLKAKQVSVAFPRVGKKKC